MDLVATGSLVVPQSLNTDNHATPDFLASDKHGGVIVDFQQLPCPGAVNVNGSGRPLFKRERCELISAVYVKCEFHFLCVVI